MEWICGNEATIEYMWDDGDVFFSTYKDRGYKLWHPKKWTEWNCGEDGKKSGENERCEMVRQGKMHWSGEYKVILLGDNNLGEAENAVAQPDQAENAVAQTDLAENDVGDCNGEEETFFYLVGDKGWEKVRVNGGKQQTLFHSETRYGDTYKSKHMEWICGNEATIEYMWDDGDVFFSTYKDRGYKLWHPKKWTEWNCGEDGKKSGENERCEMVRQGKMHWSGEYKVILLGDNNLGEAENAVAQPDLLTYSSTQTHPFSNNIVIQGFAIVGLFATCYGLWTAARNKVMQYKSIEDESEV